MFTTQIKLVCYIQSNYRRQDISVTVSGYWEKDRNRTEDGFNYIKKTLLGKALLLFFVLRFLPTAGAERHAQKHSFDTLRGTQPIHRRRQAMVRGFV